MAAIRGYFYGLDCSFYTLKVYQGQESEQFTEVELAGDSPFVVTYNTSETPFEPIRTSTATISVVHNTYLDELYTPYAHGTKVKVYRREDESTQDTCVWAGYLVPKVYSQGYVNEYETIELEAADCISSLQYFEYEKMNDNGCVSFKQLIDAMLDTTEMLDDFYWPYSKLSNGRYLMPEDLGIYEKNFFSNDTDEPWSWEEVMKEMCQYLGLTLIQWQDMVYFLDMTALGKGNDRYVKYVNKQKGSDVYISSDITMEQELSRGNDAEISFEPIFNKVVVKDNFYTVEELIPDIFDDKYLTNRNGDFYAAVECTPPSPDTANYVSKIKKGGLKTTNESKADSEYKYFLRIYDHEYYKSRYNDYDGLYGGMNTPEALSHILGATIVDLGVVDETTFVGEVWDPTGSGDGVHIGTVDYANSIDYKRYLMICEMHTEGSAVDGGGNTHKVVMRTPKIKFPCQITDDAYAIISWSETSTRHQLRPYINPDWSKDGPSCNDEHFNLKAAPQSPPLRFFVGDKCWSSHDKKWVEKGDRWDRVTVTSLKDAPLKDYWNEELKAANWVSYTMNIAETGYPIPLKGINLDDEIQIEILNPQPGTWWYKDLDMFKGSAGEKYNAFCWISDFTIKICEKGQDIEKQDSDVIYENVVDVDSVNELGEITFKFTSHHDNVKPSYSNVVEWFDGKRIFLESITEAALSGVAQKPEENTVERYVNQYDTQTKKIGITLPINSITPFDRMVGLDVRETTDKYMQLGTEINFARGNQRITYIQCK